MTADILLRAGAVIALTFLPSATSAQQTDQPQADPAATAPPAIDTPSAPPADAPGLPTDAISSAANPPDEAPSPDAAPAAPPVADIAPAPPAPDITVIDSQLLSIQTDSAGAETATPSTSIPYVVGKSCYSWALKYQPVEGDLTLTEELDLPGPARNWNIAGSGEKTEVNSQSSGATTERHFDATTGAATAGWCVAKDDPVGSYRYIIRQGEREVARFDFTVGDLL